MLINDHELINVAGGAVITTAIAWKIFGAIAAAVMSIGIFDGFTNPIKCRK